VVNLTLQERLMKKLRGYEGGPRPKENVEDGGEKGYKAISGWES